MNLILEDKREIERGIISVTVYDGNLVKGFLVSNSFTSEQVAVFEEFCGMANNQIFSVLDEIEDKIESFGFQIRGEEKAIFDLQIFELKHISFRFKDKTTLNTTNMNYNQKVSDYISNASEAQIEVLETLRDLIHESVEDVSEEIKWGFPVFGNPKDFVYFRTAKAHITLGFYNFDKIEDPDNLLEGSGKTFRNLKIRSMKDVNSALIGEWLKAVSA